MSSQGTEVQERKVVVPNKGRSSTKRGEIFDEKKVVGLIDEWNETKDLDVFRRILVETIPLIDSIALKYHFTKYDDLEALRSECIIKIARNVLPKFDKNRGRAFSVFSVAIKNYLMSLSKKITNKGRYFTGTTEEYLENMEGRSYFMEDISDEFKIRLLNTKTRFHDEPYNGAIKYLIQIFLEEGFDKTRASLCFTLTSVFNVDKKRAQFLYDYTLLILRQTLQDLKDEPLTDLELLRTHKRWSFIPEMVELIGMENVEKLATYFSGLHVTFPTKKDIENLRQARMAEQLREDPVSLTFDRNYSSFQEMIEGHTEASLNGSTTSKLLYDS